MVTYMLFLKSKKQWPSKNEVKGMLSTIGYSFDFVEFISLHCDPNNKTYKVTIVCEDGVIQSQTYEHWDYDKLVLEVEKLLLNWR